MTSQAYLIQAIQMDVMNYNNHAEKKMRVDVTDTFQVNIYIGNKLQSQNLDLQSARYYIMGMMIERVRSDNKSHMEYKIEVSRYPNKESQDPKPFFWCLKSCCGGDWCMETAGWEATYEAAWNSAFAFYQKYKTK